MRPRSSRGGRRGASPPSERVTMSFFSLSEVVPSTLKSAQEYLLAAGELHSGPSIVAGEGRGVHQIRRSEPEANLLAEFGFDEEGTGLSPPRAAVGASRGAPRFTADRWRERGGPANGSLAGDDDAKRMSSSSGTATHPPPRVSSKQQHPPQHSAVAVDEDRLRRARTAVEALSVIAATATPSSVIAAATERRRARREQQNVDEREDRSKCEPKWVTVTRRLQSHHPPQHPSIRQVAPLLNRKTDSSRGSGVHDASCAPSADGGVAQVLSNRLGVSWAPAGLSSSQGEGSLIDDRGVLAVVSPVRRAEHSGLPPSDCDGGVDPTRREQTAAAMRPAVSADERVSRGLLETMQRRQRAMESIASRLATTTAIHFFQPVALPQHSSRMDGSAAAVQVAADRPAWNDASLPLSAARRRPTSAVISTSVAKAGGAPPRVERRGSRQSSIEAEGAAVLRAARDLSCGRAYRSGSQRSGSGGPDASFESSSSRHRRPTSAVAAPLLSPSDAAHEAHILLLQAERALASCPPRDGVDDERN